ncbi:DUF4397 domain-containing protein [Nocardioides sp. InS609-2]|uniref:DUF4397 domain-containing protein n=1 Tax=Nocardioides sp. InS609-2 TaxID=2760705 RepID=UPI0020BEC53B|nr:DUF4397 domain-containing protein [Nocardioides sp. InS609-2]
MAIIRIGVGLVLTTLLISPAAAEAAKPTMASAYFVQGVTGSTWSVTVDGEELDDNVDGKGIVGPFKLEAGKHQIGAINNGSGAEVGAIFTVNAGESVDVVLHRPVDPTDPAIITTFDNNLTSVPSGSGRLTIAHTAAAPPTDIRVNGDVLLADVASGEAASTIVPQGVYPVDVVRTATAGPAVLGPVDLKVAGSALTRVFAVGVAADQTMDAVVQVLPVAETDATAPTGVPAGTGGQAAAAGTSGWGGAIGLAGLLAGSLVVALGLRRLRSV